MEARVVARGTCVAPHPTMSKQNHLVTITTDQLKNVSGGFDLGSITGMIGKIMPIAQQIGGLIQSFKGGGGGGGQQQG